MLKLFKEKSTIFFLPLIVIVFSLLRIPSVSEPIWYGDEGIYQVLGKAINEGRILYSEIWDNKPPLLYYIYALLGSDQFTVRFVSLFFGIASVIVFYFFALRLFKNVFAVVVSTTFFALFFATPVIEGNIANAENFMLLPIILAFYLVYTTNKDKGKTYIFAGILLSLAFLIKIVALFDFAALFLFITFLKISDSVKLSKKPFNSLLKITKIVWDERIILVTFIVPIILTSIYFISVGAFPDFFRATFSQNVGYVGHGNNFIFPMGLLYLKFGILILSILAVFRFRKVIGPSGVIIFLWLAFSMFNAFFSARPYTHYLLVLLPAFSLFLGYIVENKKLLIFTIPLLVVIIFLIDSDFGFYKKIRPYYENYIGFLAGKPIEEYQAFFDRNTPRDYALASFIKTNTTAEESVFLWSDSSQIYVLADKLPPGRYAVAYHVTFYPDGISETKEVIDRVAPKYIIQTKEHEAIANFIDNYELKYLINNSRIYERKY